MIDLAIGDYAMLSDCRTAALVSREGSVDWLCFPRFDAPAVLARILGPEAGHFRIGPAVAASVERRYLDQSLVLETTYRTDGGAVRVVDALAVGPTDRGHRLGAHAPHALLRQVEGVEGAVELDVELAPRPEYGLARPLLCAQDGGVVTRGGPDVVALASPVPLRTGDGEARARFVVRAGDRLGFALQWARAWDPPPERWTGAEIAERLTQTHEAWRSWSAIHQGYQGPYRDAVHHSGRVLQGLTFQPTGAIVAAPTTSLPEQVGGERNWDYRYSWVRDASLTLDALWVAACPDEAADFVRWMVGAAAGDVSRGDHLQIMFGVGGEKDLTERVAKHLPGWRASAPVRIGNGAWEQRQLDVYGELLDAVHRLADNLGELDGPTRQFLVDLADAAAAHWDEPDQGIWEVRSGPQHFLYSKLMCWVALDRAIELAPRIGAESRVDAWRQVGEGIRSAILERGYDEGVGAFTQAFGSSALDASALMLAITGFLAADHPRMASTIRAVEEQLTDRRGLVYRYQGAEDGLAGEEGTFLLCTFWLAHCHALSGRVEEARAVFERAAGYANDVGLLAEEVDPATGELLGNFPQAFSHIGLVNAAWAISRAEAPPG